jgi:hypothetical protein
VVITWTGLTVFRNIRVYELSRPNANEVIVQNKYFQPGQTKTELVQVHQIDKAYPAPHMAYVVNHDDTSIILTRTVCTLLVDTPCTLHLEIYKYIYSLI